MTYHPDNGTICLDSGVAVATLTPDGTHADGSLLAAAPELLAACDKLLDAAARGCPHPEAMLAEAIALAKAAYAKANRGG